MSFRIGKIITRAMSTTVNFVWPHPGQKVQLAGTFTDWKPIDMIQIESNGWSVDLGLNAGSHEFKFVVDGNWIHDPDRASHVNDMGSHNNIITIPAEVIERPDSPVEMSTSESSTSDEGDWEIVQKSDVLEKIPAKTHLMEIERKFIVPEDFKERLLNHGFQLVQEFEEVLQDKYYDTADYHLLHQDFWLRQRNGDWELKYPVGPKHSQEGSTLYHETSSNEDILSKIVEIVPALSGSNVEDLSELLESGMLKSFANLETRRQCFQRNEINIVVDDTDWDYRIGEIEILLTDQTQVSQALLKIETLAKQLAFTDLDLVAVAKKVCQNSSNACF